MIDLNELGWNAHFEAHYANYRDRYGIGRVAVVHRNMCRVHTAAGEIQAAISRKLHEDLTDISGRSHYNLSEVSQFPAVGDWVLLSQSRPDEKALVHGVLPRKSRISRNDPGKATEELVIAANIDRVLLVMALNFDFNLRRVERYLTILWNSNVDPVIILNKADLCPDVEDQLALVQAVAMDSPIHITCALDGSGVDELRSYFQTGTTCVMLGSSGVGKTSIINQILGEERYVVQEISDYKDKGKHTTSAREMIFLDNGGILIDTPGLRRIDLWSEQDGFDDVFADIVELSQACKFRNCSHNTEPDCAVQAAIEAGDLHPKRLTNYRKLQAELAYTERKARSRADRRGRISHHQRERVLERQRRHMRTE